MDRALYDDVAERCRQALAQQRELEDFFPDEFMQQHNNNSNTNRSNSKHENNINVNMNSSGASCLTWDTILSIRSQISQNLLRKNSYKHRSKAFLTKCVREYKNGKSIEELARNANCPPCYLARVMIEVILGIPNKKRLSKLIKDPSLIADERLRRELETCIEIDTQCSPHVDRLRHGVGAECEVYLESILKRSGVCFQSEDDLRRLGLSKTPDVLLPVPIGVKDNEGRYRVINWIDSKGMFGDPATHLNKNMEQLQGYVNRFGSGMVIYWAGFVRDLNQDPDILLTSDFPKQHVSIT